MTFLDLIITHTLCIWRNSSDVLVCSAKMGSPQEILGSSKWAPVAWYFATTPKSNLWTLWYDFFLEVYWSIETNFSIHEIIVFLVQIRKLSAPAMVPKKQFLYLPSVSRSYYQSSKTFSSSQLSTVFELDRLISTVFSTGWLFHNILIDDKVFSSWTTNM